MTKLNEIKDALEEGMRNSFKTFIEVSKPRGYAEDFLMGVKVAYKSLLESYGATLEDCGTNDNQDAIAIMFATNEGERAFLFIIAQEDGEPIYHMNVLTPTGDSNDV